jgi:thiol-disulfide isomerase/thioredoxin
MRRWLALGTACLLAGCGSAPPRATTTLSLRNLDCSDCGETLARTLIDEQGIYRAAFDKRTAEVTVVADAKIDVLSLAAARRPKNEDWEIVAGKGRGGYLAWQPAPEGADVQQVSSNGEDVPSLTPFLVSGKVTIVDFSAKWCEPCRRMDEHVMELVTKRADIAYRKLDVGDWDTPLSTHYLEGVKELPHALVFDRRGRQLAVISGLDLEALDRAVEEASK